MTVHFSPLADQTINVCDFVGEFFFFVWIEAFSYSALAKSPAFTDGIDSAPGGQFDLYSFDDGTNPLITEFVANLNLQYFNFIPTLSALAIDEPNWYATPHTSNSPFDRVYIPDHNEPHVTLTEGNVAFVLEEIFNGTLSIPEPLSAQVRIKQNPVTDMLQLNSSLEPTKALVTIYNTMGQRVFMTETLLDNDTTIPLQLTTGVYILDVQTNNRENYRTKLVVR